MIGIVIERSYADIPEKISYTGTAGFAETIAKLKEIQRDAENDCILVDLDGVIRLFQSFYVLDDEDGSLYFRYGNAVFIEDPQEFIHTFGNTESTDKSDNVWKIWLSIIQSVNETIRELCRYGAGETDEDIMFLTHVLMFLSYMDIHDRAVSGFN